MRLLEGVQADAVLSEDGVYRYVLERWWAYDPHDVITRSREAHSAVRWACWIMLNPSTATADVDDATIRKIQKFSRSWGYGGARVVNLFALRSSKPKALYGHPDPIGPANDNFIVEAVRESDLVVAAWGVHGALHQRGEAVVEVVVAAGRDLHALRLTNGGHPWHPLYRPDDEQPFVWRAA